MFAVTHRKIFYIFSTVLLVASMVLLIAFPLKFSIDFTGGSVLEVVYPQGRPEQQVITQTIDTLGLGTTIVQPTGTQGVSIKMPTITQETKTTLIDALEKNGTVVEQKFTTIGPTLGKELVSQSIWAIVLVLLGIACYVAYVFRHVSKPVSSWKYGFGTIIALVHDIIITMGAFAVLGALYGTEIDTLFVTALLVILGYSVNDSIVVLDRVRENLGKQSEKGRGAQFEAIVGKSLKETMGRSLNTSLTTIVSLLALIFFGSEATRNFSIALIVGIGIGTYSSICIASSLLVSFFEHQKKHPKKQA